MFWHLPFKFLCDAKGPLSKVHRRRPDRFLTVAEPKLHVLGMRSHPKVVYLPSVFRFLGCVGSGFSQPARHQPCPIAWP